MKQLYFLPLIFITPLFGQSLQTPNFSHESGFYEDEFNLTLTHDDPNATIIYTLDGSEPDINNLEGRTYQYKKQYPELPGQVPFEFYENSLISYNFASPILVYNRSSEPNKIANISTSFQYEQYFPSEPIDKSFVVRAKAYLENESSTTTTHVYFVNSQTSTLPIINLSTDDEKLFGYEKGLFTAGKDFDNWRVLYPNEIPNSYSSANYWASGSDSEIRINFIYIENNEVKINQDAGLRNNGNGTRYLSNRPFRIYAKNDYGKNTFSHNFFENYENDIFKRLILRNSGQDTESTLFKDAFVHKLNEHLNFDTQNYQPVSTFINGEYYGIFNLRERFDEKYFETIYNLNEEEIDYLENDGIVDLGDANFYNEMMTYFSLNDLSIDDNYQQAITYFDEVNFIDYSIAEIYAANIDWPQNNYNYFRKRVNYTPEAPYGHDGRFRFLFKDLDLSFLPYSSSFNALEHAMYNSIFGNEFNNVFFSSILQNEIFKQNFINRFADLINTTYKPERVVSLINSTQGKISEEMPQHIERWNLIPSLEKWEDNVERIREFANERPYFQRIHITEFFNLEGTYELTTNVANVEEGFVKVNTIEINNSTVGIDGDYSTWSGDYFKGVPVKLQAIALPGYTFSHWTGDVDSTESEITINPEENTNVIAVFQRDLSIGDVNKVDFLVYPNPTSDVLNIASASKSEITYTISTILGQNVESGINKDQKLNVSHLNKGVYLIELKQDNKRVVKKFIKK
ncbi:CotH kinase family protein [Faecalibacter macacae]|uniref:T9SS C-terminal target domain-containing protein n=1 Tax=Faecalibacter macacae TaxID=1859289 RepID=A0A3L9M6F8_9FLAO|nr:CotH kinase family protein [Faecalibacter macacae]RLZ06864.1 T9SS C-terminal target domain-containing protein [Faecalibacter macacae]